jgi:hypothetical protein
MADELALFARAHVDQHGLALLDEIPRHWRGDAPGVGPIGFGGFGARDAHVDGVLCAAK